MENPEENRGDLCTNKNKRLLVCLSEAHLDVHSGLEASFPTMASKLLSVSQLGWGSQAVLSSFCQRFSCKIEEDHWHPTCFCFSTVHCLFSKCQPSSSHGTYDIVHQCSSYVHIFSYISPVSGHDHNAKCLKRSSKSPSHEEAMSTASDTVRERPCCRRDRRSRGRGRTRTYTDDGNAAAGDDERDGFLMLQMFKLFPYVCTYL